MAESWTGESLDRFARAYVPLVNLAGRWARLVQGTLPNLGKEGHQVSATAIHSAFTAADALVQETVLYGLASSLPEVAPIAEEETRLAAEAPDADRFLSLDPIDGTLAFTRGHGGYCTMLSLFDRAGLALGALHFPNLRRTVFGGAGWGVRQAAYGSPDDGNPSETGNHELVPLELGQAPRRHAAVHYRAFVEPHESVGARLTGAGWTLKTLAGAPVEGIATLGSNGELLLDLLSGGTAAYIAPYVSWHDLAPLAAIVQAFGAVRFYDAARPAAEPWRRVEPERVIAGVIDGTLRRCRAILARDADALDALEALL